ncbi:N-acetyltransferase, partial [Rhizobium ruizarguesonis]
MTIDIRRLRDRLPQEMAGLESGARREGYRHV